MEHFKSSTMEPPEVIDISDELEACDFEAIVEREVKIEACDFEVKGEREVKIEPPEVIDISDELEVQVVQPELKSKEPTKVTNILAASVDVESCWPGLVARALEEIDVGAGIRAPPVAGIAPASAGGDVAPTKEEKKEEKRESDQSDDDMGFVDGQGKPLE